MDEDTVSLPHQQSFSSLRTDSDYIYQVHTPSIHMPLYESLASKPSASKQKTSLYSLASRRDPKTASTSRSSSQLTFYGTSPDARNLLSIRKKALKSTPELGKNIMSERENFIDSQKSTPDLSYEKPNWNSELSKSGKYSASGSITNLIMSPNTASNFIYKPNENNSRANLFSDSVGTEITSTILNTSVQENALIAEKSLRDENIPPPLESSLENILNTNVRQTIDPQRSSASEYDSKMENFIELSSAKCIRSANDRDDPAASSSTDVETKIGPATRKSPAKTRERDDSKSTESGGLGDYLQSLKSPNYRSPLRKNADNEDPQTPQSPD